jgi:hypothetical protein
MAELISQAEYARRRGVSQEAVRKAAAKKRITLLPDANGRLMVDPEVADIQWAKNTDPDQSARANAPKGKLDMPGSGDPGPSDKANTPYWDARCRREVAEATRAELEMAKLAGYLVERKRVEEAAFRTSRMMRDAMLSLPARLAPELAALTDVWEIERRIAAGLRQVLDDMSKVTAADLERAMEA